MQPITFAPVGPLLVVAGVLSGLLLIGSAVALAYWIYRDASARDANGPLWWTFLAFTGVGLVWYLLARGDRAPETGPPTRGDRLASTWTTAIVLAFLVTAVTTPPDPFSQLVALPPLFVVSFAGVSLWRTLGRPAVARSGN